MKSESGDILKKHLNGACRAWRYWNKNMPMYVKVVCNDIAKKYGRFLLVRQWLIIPPESGFKECLVAEFNISVNNFGKNEPLQLHINHLVPANDYIDECLIKTKDRP